MGRGALIVIIFGVLICAGISIAAAIAGCLYVKKQRCDKGKNRQNQRVIHDPGGETFSAEEAGAAAAVACISTDGQDATAVPAGSGVAENAGWDRNYAPLVGGLFFAISTAAAAARRATVDEEEPGDDVVYRPDGRLYDVARDLAPCTKKAATAPTFAVPSSAGSSVVTAVSDSTTTANVTTTMTTVVSNVIEMKASAPIEENVAGATGVTGTTAENNINDYPEAKIAAESQVSPEK